MIISGGFTMLDIKFEDFKESKYRGTGEFHEGLARIVNHDNKYGFMNRSGKEVIACQFALALDFSESLAAVQNESGLWGYIDYDGNLVIPYQYEHAYNFKNGLAVVVNDHDEWGYINREGKEVIPCQFKQARAFEEGYGIVQDNNFMYRYIDEASKLSAPYEECLNFENGTAVVKLNGIWQIIGNDFEVKRNLPKSISKFYHSSCGIRRFQDNDGNYGYIDAKGSFRAPLYESMRQFSNDVAITTLLEERGILTKKGSFVPFDKEQYDEIGDFYEEFARTTKGRQYGYIDKNGKELKPCQYKEADRFSEGLAGVMTEEGSISYINKKGNTKFIIPDLYCSRFTYGEQTVILTATTAKKLRKLKIQKLDEIKKAYVGEIDAVKQELKGPQYVLKDNQ